MKRFYKRLLIIGVAIGIFICTLIVGVSQVAFMINGALTKNEEKQVELYSIFRNPEGNGYATMGIMDAEKIQKLFPQEDIYATYEGIGTKNVPIKYGDELLSAHLFMTDHNYLNVSTLELLKGRYFTKEENDSRKKVCIIHEYLYKALGSKDNLKLNINGEAYDVIGVVKGISGGASGIPKSVRSDDQMIFMPSYTYYQYMEEAPPQLNALIDQVMIKAPKKYSREYIDKIISEYASKTLDEASLKVFAEGEQEKLMLLNTLRVVKNILIISAMVLVIAGLNIIQIASANIYDIKKEIGLKMAVGAKRFHIMKEIGLDIFLCTLKGGYIGIACYAIVFSLLNKFLRDYTGFTEILSPILRQYTEYYRLTFNINTALLGILLAVVLGIISSLIPARRAASIDPIAALRKE